MGRILIPIPNQYEDFSPKRRRVRAIPMRWVYLSSLYLIDSLIRRKEVLRLHDISYHYTNF